MALQADVSQQAGLGAGRDIFDNHKKLILFLQKFIVLENVKI